MVTSQVKRDGSIRGLATVAAGVILALSCVVSGAEEAADKLSVTGYVLTVENDTGTVVSVKLIVAGDDDDVIYYITLDETGKKIAKLDGKDVKVTGTIAVKDKAKWLTVGSFSEAKEKEDAAP